MKLGFVSAVVSDLSVEQVFAFAAEEGFDCVELMCWPPGDADRRYAGVCHVDCSNFNEDYAEHLREQSRIHKVGISGLGYYPNPLDADAAHRGVISEHLKKVIRAAALIGVPIVNTFIGRDPKKSIEENQEVLHQVWPGIVAQAKQSGIQLAIENCPMLFSKNEWPGGKNLAVSPAIWRQLFADFPDLGLNLDPSHLIWQFIDPARCIREFGPKIFHVHAKDTRIDHDKLYSVGSMGQDWHTAKLPGLGDVNWGAFFSALTDAQYHGAVCIEVEDRAYEGSFEDRQRSLRQSRRYLQQWIA